MAKHKKQVHNKHQLNILIKCPQCQKGFYGDKSCFSGAFIENKTSPLGCWTGVRLHNDQ